MNLYKGKYENTIIFGEKHGDYIKGVIIKCDDNDGNKKLFGYNTDLFYTERYEKSGDQITITVDNENIFYDNKNGILTIRGHHKGFYKPYSMTKINLIDNKIRIYNTYNPLKTQRFDNNGFKIVLKNK